MLELTTPDLIVDSKVQLSSPIVQKYNICRSCAYNILCWTPIFTWRKPFHDAQTYLVCANLILAEQTFSMMHEPFWFVQTLSKIKLKNAVEASLDVLL
jgi:hypothetical protein